MTRMRTIDLRGKVPAAGGFEFLAAEVLEGRRAPLARVHALGPDKQPVTLRLDMNKDVFMNGGEDSGQDEVVRQAAAKIAEVVYRQLD